MLVLRKLNTNILTDTLHKIIIVHKYIKYYLQVPFEHLKTTIENNITADKYINKINIILTKVRNHERDIKIVTFENMLTCKSHFIIIMLIR